MKKLLVLSVMIIALTLTLTSCELLFPPQAYQPPRCYDEQGLEFTSYENGTCYVKLVEGHYYNYSNYTCDVVTHSGTIHAECISGKDDIEFAYELELDELFNMIKNGEMQESYERLLLPVRVLNAIYESCKTGKEVKI